MLTKLERKIRREHTRRTESALAPVEVVINHQSFRVYAGPATERTDAEWWRTQIAIALARLVETYAGKGAT